MSIFDFLDKYHISYKDKDLISHAFYHSSFVNEHKDLKGDNERLEFMGDSVLQIYSASILFNKDPKLDEGDMSKQRANMVCENTLAKIAREFKLNDYLMLGQGEEKTGGRDRDSIISDMFEAFIGAVYIDTDINNVFKLLDILFKNHIDSLNEDVIDYKTKLQEYVQMDSRRSIEYEQIYSKGPCNKPEFKMAVKIDGITYGYGVGPTKKDAQKMAAKDALDKVAK